MGVGLYIIRVLPLNYYYRIYSRNQYTVRGLRLGVNYSISISGATQLGMHGYGACYNPLLYGEYSEPIFVETYETGKCMQNRLDIISSTPIINSP